MPTERLYDRSDNILTYKNYKEYQWINEKKNYVNFNKPVTPGSVIRYYYDAGGGISSDWQIDAYTDEFPEIKTMIDHSVKTQKISGAVYESLKSIFPRIQKETSYQTGNRTYHFNCIAWSLGFVDRWINPPNTTYDFIRLYKRFGYVQTALKGSDAMVDLYYDSNNEGTHA